MKQAHGFRRQRGVLIVWLALFLLVLIGFVSVGVDLAKLAVTQSQLQAAADAAALSGGTAIDSLTGGIIQAEAVARAQDTGSRNKAYEMIATPVAINAADITFPSDSTIKVIAKRVDDTGMVTHFVGAFLGSAFHKLNMQASAVAEVRRAGAACCGLIPVSGIPPVGQDFQTGCDHIYDMRLAPGGGIQGDYYFVDFPPCDQGACAGFPETGANTLRCLIRNGYCCCITVGQVLQAEPGSMSGPFVQSINTLFDNDADQREGICFKDYTGTGDRIVTVPLTTPPTGARGPVTITGFAKFFLRDRPKGGAQASLVGEFIQGVIRGAGGGGPPGVNSFIVHLVK